MGRKYVSNIFNLAKKSILEVWELFRPYRDCSTAIASVCWTIRSHVKTVAALLGYVTSPKLIAISFYLICFFETWYKPLNTYCFHSKKQMEARLTEPLLLSCIDSIRCLPLHRMPQPLDSSKLDPTPPLLTQLYADVRWIKNTSLNSFENLNYKSYYVLQIWFGKKHWILNS